MPPLTDKGARTRARIVEDAALLLHQRGVGATTLDDVKAVASVSSSQLYHYFGNKQALVLAVADHQAATILANQAAADLSTPEGLRIWRDTVVDQVARTAGLGGCPLGSLGVQVAENDEVAREHVAAGFEGWADSLKQGLRTLEANGGLVDGVDPDDVAQTLLATLQGGLLLAQVQRRTQGLETALDTLLTLVTPQ